MSHPRVGRQRCACREIALIQSAQRQPGYGLKRPVPVAVPAAVVIESGPTVAPAGTTAVMLVGETIVNAAGTPLNRTDVAPAKLAPVMVTLVPARPLVGVKLEIRGATAKPVLLVAVRPPLW